MSAKVTLCHISLTNKIVLGLCRIAENIRVDFYKTAAKALHKSAALSREFREQAAIICYVVRHASINFLNLSTS